MIIIKAFITLLSSLDYLEGVLVLNKSLLAVNSKFPLVVAISDNIFNENIEKLLLSEKIIVEKIPYLNYSNVIKKKYANLNVLHTASKFSIFNLKSYDKLVYIDADTLILQNVDELFDYPDGSMIKYKNENSGFSGLFVFEPKNHNEFEYYINLINIMDKFDGDILEDLWFYVKTSLLHQIPEHYLVTFNKYLINLENIKIVHFSSSPIKPWHNNYNYLSNNQILKYYKQLLVEVRIILYQHRSNIKK